MLLVSKLSIYRQDEGGRIEVPLGGLGLVLLALELALVALEVLDHEVLARQLVVVAVVVDAHVLLEVAVVEQVLHGAHVHPVEVPIVAASTTNKQNCISIFSYRFDFRYTTLGKFKTSKCERF